MRGRPGQQRLPLLRVEVPPGQPADVRQTGEGELQHLGHAAGRRTAQLAGEEEVDDVAPVLDQRPEQPPIGRAVGAQPVGGLLERPERHRRPPAVERVGVADLRVHEPHAAAGQVELAEERRGRGHRLHGRAHVVRVTGAGQLLGPHAAAGTVGPLDHLHPQPGRGQAQGSGQPVRPRADDDGVRSPVHPPILRGRRRARRSELVEQLVRGPVRVGLPRHHPVGQGSQGRRAVHVTHAPAQAARAIASISRAARSLRRRWPSPEDSSQTRCSSILTSTSSMPLSVSREATVLQIGGRQ